METTRKLTSNSILRWEFVGDDGTRWTDKCRNTIGGFSNMMNRAAERMGERLRSADGGQTWTAAGVTFTIEER